MWVQNNISYSFDKGITTAYDILESKNGNCIHYALLTAALLKAIGIDTRIVAGLKYHESRFIFHMWLDYFDEGNWYSIDPIEKNTTYISGLYIRLWVGPSNFSLYPVINLIQWNYFNLKCIKIEEVKYEYGDN
ncbi:MAG: transglutaminase-like domain-containing protein [Nitrososphaerota archaeon]